MKYLWPIVAVIGVALYAGVTLLQSYYPPRTAASTIQSTPTTTNRRSHRVTGRMVLACRTTTGLSTLDRLRAMNAREEYESWKKTDCQEVAEGTGVDIEQKDDFSRSVYIVGDSMHGWVHSYDVF